MKLWDNEGVIVFRNILSPGDLIDLRSEIYTTYYESRRYRKDVKALLLSLDTYPRKQIREGIVSSGFQTWIEGCMNIANDKRFIYLYEKILKTEVINKFLNFIDMKDFIPTKDYALMRLIDPSEKNAALQYHQDAVFLRGISDPRNFLNFWINLDPIDGLRPTIEYLTGNYADKIFPQLTPNTHSIFTDMTLVDDKIFKPYNPKLSLGDVVIASPFVIHRSLVDDCHFLPRASIDFRIQSSKY